MKLAPGLLVSADAGLLLRGKWLPRAELDKLLEDVAAAIQPT
jgi:Zn-finger nucleic acid-binding protein